MKTSAACLVRTGNFKIVTRELKTVDAAAAMDAKGRVLVLIDQELTRREKLLYTLWGILQFVKFKLNLSHSTEILVTN